MIETKTERDPDTAAPRKNAKQSTRKIDIFRFPKIVCNTRGWLMVLQDGVAKWMKDHFRRTMMSRNEMTHN